MPVLALTPVRGTSPSSHGADTHEAITRRIVEVRVHIALRECLLGVYPSSARGFCRPHQIPFNTLEKACSPTRYSCQSIILIPPNAYAEGVMLSTAPSATHQVKRNVLSAFALQDLSSALGVPKVLKALPPHIQVQREDARPCFATCVVVVAVFKLKTIPVSSLSNTYLLVSQSLLLICRLKPAFSMATS